MTRTYELRNILERARISQVSALALVDQGISELPPEIGALDKLEQLDVSHNALTVLPPEIGALKRLKWLNVANNALAALPAELGHLNALEQLDLTNNSLTDLPDSLADMENSLLVLALGGNNFREMPRVVCKLRNLRQLWLNHNEFSDLPAFVENLSSLVHLNISYNKFINLPFFLGFMTQIQRLDVDGMDLRFPPTEIVTQGTGAILGFLREWADGSEQQWMSKLLVVGEGGVGKTSVVRSLLGENFRQQEETTHGIDIRVLRLAHPEVSNVEMVLNVWDFGGQPIYHATHQFFLSDRSLFLLVWNTRFGYEQCRVIHWLETINALAPSSPILLVATNADQRDADLPLSLIRQKHEKVFGQYVVSNVNGSGIPELREAVAKNASTLPLMGETWPRTWTKAADPIRTSKRRYMTPNELKTEMMASGVAELSWTTLAQWLHELGELLYFRRHEELKDTVILKPQWVTSYISKVLEDEDVIRGKGIFTKKKMDRLWDDLEPHIRRHFLLLMERFDLSYQTLEDKDISLVVERLPLDPPYYESRWEKAKDDPFTKEISMRFRLGTMPAGIPTWFIARSHRFTTRTHWRTGALFAYGPEQRHLKYTPEETHLALVQAHPYDRYVELIVRGPNPQGFFSVLKDGFEVTLSRFPGLRIERRIPCPGHQGNKCSHEFDYVQLLKRYERNRPTIECPEGMESVSVAELLFGMHWSTSEDVLVHLTKLKEKVGEMQNRIGYFFEELETGQRETTYGINEIQREIKDFRELAQLEFSTAFRREQSKIESCCPNVFVLKPRDRAMVESLAFWEPFMRMVSGGWVGQPTGPAWLEAIAGQWLELKLYCQAPGCWHPVQEGGQYEIDQPSNWIQLMMPYISGLVKVLRFVAPLVGPWITIVDKEAYLKDFKDDIDFIAKLCQQLPEVGKKEKGQLVDQVGNIAEQEPAIAKGAALRSLRELLDKKDPNHTWGNLRLVFTPEGHYLWLCEYHSQSYARLAM